MNNKKGYFEIKTFRLTKINNFYLLLAEGNLLYYILMKMMYVTIQGSCPVADLARKKANIYRRRSYRQHMSVGVMKFFNLPNEVISVVDIHFMKVLAQDFISLTTFSNQNIHLKLVDENITVWIVTFIVENNFIRITISFDDKGGKKIFKVVTNTLTFNEYLKLDGLQLKKENDISHFVSLLYNSLGKNSYIHIYNSTVLISSKFGSFSEYKNKYKMDFPIIMFCV